MQTQLCTSQKNALKKALHHTLSIAILLFVTGNIATAQYCSIPPVDCTDGDRLVRLQFSNINHSPSCNPTTGYNNYTTSVAAGNVATGSAYTLTAEVGYEMDDVAIWIDYNQNNIFEAAEFTWIGSSTSSTYTLTNTVNIPATALTGTTRMRVMVLFLWGLYSGDACMPFWIPGDYGEANDYTINITSAAIPACVSAPTAPANAGTACAGTTTLSWPAVTGATGYDVYLNTGATATTIVSTNQPGTTYSGTVTAGNYAWRVVPKNSQGSATGCTNFTFTATAPTTPSVSITATPSGTICSGTPVTYTATPVNGGTTPAYQWKKGTTNVGANTSTYTDNTLTATDVISVVMTSNAACPATATATSNTITPTIIPRPTATITASGPTTFCDGSNVTLSANTGTGFTYQWKRNNVNIATTPTYNASLNGDYHVIVSNGTCRDSSAIISLSVLPAPVATISPAGANAICQGSSLLLTGPSLTTGLTATWLRNGTAIPGANAATYVATAAGEYKLVFSNGSCTDTSAAATISINPLPTATVTAAGSTTFCTGGSVLLNANNATGVAYQWLRNNAIIAGATTSAYTATLTGVYTVVVRNTATGCADTSDPGIPVLVSTVPSATLTVTGALTFCEGGNVRLQAATGTGFTYVWYRNNIVIAGATTSTYTATTTGTYHAVITNGSCATTATSRAVVVNPLPAATIAATGPVDFCAGGSVALNANTGAGLTYQWRLGGINIPGAVSPAYTASASGTYDVIISNGTCTNTSNGIAISVSTMPLPVITASGATSFCQGGSVTINANIAAGYTYQWQFNGNAIVGATASAYTATAAGRYTVIITNGACVATSAPLIITVAPAPLANITPSGSTTFCQGGTLLLNASRRTGYTYQWTRNNINVPGATNWQFTAVNSGDYAVKVFDGSCNAESAPVTVSVGSIPVAVITVTNGVNMSTDPFAAYQWYRNGLIIPGANTQNHTATRDGYYAVVVTDITGCTATSSVQLITALDVSNIAPGLAVKVWPNPVTNYINIETTAIVDLSLTAIDGKELIRSNQVKQMDVSLLPQGTYLLHINDHRSGALIGVRKIIKQ